MALVGVGELRGLGRGLVRERYRGGGGYDFTPTESVSIVTEEFEFVPKDFSIKAGVITEIMVENRDAAFHTFTYELDGKTYNHDLVGGKTATFLVRVDGPQTIKFWCEPHKPDMAGELAVQ